MAAPLRSMLLVAIVVAASLVTADACRCTKELKPVCAVNGKTYSNECLAKCDNVKVAYRGECVPGDQIKLPTCPRSSPSILCFAAGCTVSNSACKGRSDLACISTNCGASVKMQGYTIPAGCQAVYVTKDAGIVVPGCLPKPDCFCTEQWQPVCGVDKKTYGNACPAACVAMPVAYRGTCLSDSICSTAKCSNEESYVCGKNGKTYLNPCRAVCGAGVEVAHAGKCKKDCSAVLCATGGSGVCGVDGKTYPNECIAECAGTHVAYKEPCFTGDCSRVRCGNSKKVCGADGKTYDSPCKAICGGRTKVAYPGSCNPGVCACTPADVDPVCGKNGKTYTSRCAARCDKVQVQKEGPCKACICTKIGDPVCGRDGKTYGNPCMADCARVKVAYKGACKPPTISTIPCQPGNPSVKCRGDVCAQANKCKGNRKYTCVVNGCKNNVPFQGLTLARPCSPVYLSKTTGVIDTSCK